MKASLGSFAEMRWKDLIFTLVRGPKFSFCRQYSAQGGVNSYTSRTHTCGELSSLHIGKDVSLSGWLQYKRMNKFAILRDAYGFTQLVIADQSTDLRKKLKNSSLESVLSVNGTVVARPDSEVNHKIPTGEVEVLVNDFSVVGPAKKELPFNIRDYQKAKEQIRMKYRYLDLRFSSSQRFLRLRSEFLMRVRNFLANDRGFVDVETPTLFRRTPGGAQEFIVPTRSCGQFYSLVQSPQQLKQLLMVGGIDRYFQIARCYRDEGGKPDRQPEFTQLDIELSFSSGEGVMSLIEDLLATCWPRKLPTPFPKMSYDEAMEHYGCDKPDTRFPQKIVNLDKALDEMLIKADNTARGIKFSKRAGDFTNALKEKVEKIGRKHFQEVSHKWIGLNPSSSELILSNEVTLSSSFLQNELGLEEGDLALVAFGKQKATVELMGKLRTFLISSLKEVPVNQDNFLWVVDFPLFLEGDSGKLESAHHPFTAPHPADVNLLSSDPQKVRGAHYDLVLNGNEVGGGSVRIHVPALQEFILSRILDIPSEQLAHLLEAFQYGAPPHAGIALGIDRLVALMTEAPSIRDVIAFPKTADGRDLMCSAPSTVLQNELDLYHISVKKENVKITATSGQPVHVNYSQES